MREWGGAEGWGWQSECLLPVPGSASKCKVLLQAEETLNTLKFATRAKKVKITALRNKINDEKSQIMMYQRKVHALQQQLQEVKAAQALTGNTASNVAPPVSVDDMQVLVLLSALGSSFLCVCH